MQVTNPSFFVLLIILMGMVLVWFVLVKLLFNRLSAAHPRKYEAMGRPSLFQRNGPSEGLVLLKFLFAREHRMLEDGYLSKLSDFMLAFLGVYLVQFFGVLLVFFNDTVATREEQRSPKIPAVGP